ncbi:MAG: hypothetical protein ACSHYA_14130 [Opitutaceae bacterium]
MVAFDTNHLLRHLLQDDALKCAHVERLLAEQSEVGQSVLILDLVIMETCWVMMNVYKLVKNEWCAVLGALLSDPVFEFEDACQRRFKSGVIAAV